MNLHEYQAKKIFAEYGIPVPAGIPARSPSDAAVAAGKLGGGRWVVKAQVHAGGRGKGGGIKLVESVDDVESAAKAMLGSQLVTPQTGAEGLPVHTVLVENASAIDRELYLGALIDRSRERIVFMASSAGGMDIEEVAETTPEKIVKVVIDPVAEFQAYQARQLGFALGLNKKQVGQFTRIFDALYQMFIEKDLSLIEINPLIVTADGDLVALDAKVNIDDNALFRHADLADLNDASQTDPLENEASEHDLNYVALDGDIACMVNGAGLAMATMDIIKLHGGEPANFLDVGGGATAERVTEAFKIVLSNPRVRTVLVNIFGGIVHCDVIAKGITTAVRDVGVSLPVVARLEGTNVKKGHALLAESGLDIITAGDLTDAAKKAVAAARAGS